MEALESIQVEFIKEIKRDCPFQTSAEAVGVELEDIAHDDLPDVAEIQENSGGTLGNNLAEASNGKKGTWNDICPPDKADPDPRVDTRFGGGMVRVEEKDGEEEYPYGVAAHHLVPGEAALAPSSLYKSYMVEGAKVKTKKGTHRIMANIGYNVNGAHNGVWLPGNYAIRKKTSPKKDTSWGDLGPDYDDWCFDYMCACVLKAGGQFHDSHTGYSDKVRAHLNKLCRALVVHQDGCDECGSKKDIPPPYTLKTRLYQTSNELRGFLRTVPAVISGKGRTKWKMPWCTSDRFKDALIAHNMMSR